MRPIQSKLHPEKVIATHLDTKMMRTENSEKMLERPLISSKKSITTKMGTNELMQLIACCSGGLEKEWREHD